MGLLVLLTTLGWEPGCLASLKPVVDLQRQDGANPLAQDERQRHLPTCRICWRHSCGGGGFEVLRRLKADATLLGVPLIIVTPRARDRRAGRPPGEQSTTS